MDWQTASLNAPMTTVFFTYIRTPEPERDWPATDKARRVAEHLWAMVDARLQGQDFVCGAAPTLADIALGPYLHRWQNLPIARAPMRPRRLRARTLTARIARGCLSCALPVACE